MQSLNQIEALGGVASVMDVIAWIRNFVAKPHTELGRPGAVCPFMARALDSGSIYFKTVDTASTHNLDEFIAGQADIFLNTAPTQGKARLNKAIVLVFPGLADADARDIIERTQSRLKPFFVERGLMLGEFHRNHPGEAVHNKDFRPLQSPEALLVVRHLVPSDLMFLNRQSDSAARRAHFIQSYLRIYAQSLPPALHAQAITSYEQALSELALERTA
jgi:hypothetical protein